MRTKGKIAAWNDKKGYGFIQPVSGGEQMFVHVSALRNRERRPEVGEVITYSVSSDRQGRPCAANATLAGDKLPKTSRRRPGTTAILFAAVFLGAIALLATTGFLSKALMIVYFSLSLVTFIAYALDKSAARRDAWRISESALFTLGLLGGWPGALIAQETLRHKSRKRSFRRLFWASVLLNIALLVWAHTDSGAAALPNLAGLIEAGVALAD